MKDEELKKTCMHFVKKYAIPSHLIRALLLYARERQPVGHFLQNVIANDLMGAMGRAAPVSRASLYQLTMFIFNELPSPCWGTQSRYNMWLAEEKEWKVEMFEKWRHEEEGVYVDRSLTYCIIRNREEAHQHYLNGATTPIELRDALNEDLMGDLALLEAAAEILIEEFEEGE